MSRGPGHIERTLKALFATEPNAAFTTEELACRVYPHIKHVQKKHRVAVIRTAKKFLPWRMSDGGAGRTLVFYTSGNEASYALARMKPCPNHHDLTRAPNDSIPDIGNAGRMSGRA